MSLFCCDDEPCERWREWKDGLVEPSPIPLAKGARHPLGHHFGLNSAAHLTHFRFVAIPETGRGTTRSSVSMSIPSGASSAVVA